MNIFFNTILAFHLSVVNFYITACNLPFENNQITIEKIMAGFFGVCVYFIPTIIARDKIHFKRIFLLNFLTAWTGIGWFVSLLWALKAKSKNLEYVQIDENNHDK